MTDLARVEAAYLDAKDAFAELGDAIKGIEPKPAPMPAPEMAKGRIALVVGHSARDGGAYSETLGVQEYEWNKGLAALIKGHAEAKGYACAVFLRDGHGLAGAYGQARDWGADLGIELHFNASANTQAHGVESLYLSEGGKRLATDIQRRMVAATGLRDRGVKTPQEASGGRGTTNLRQMRVYQTLLEGFFGTNANDSRTVEALKDDLALAIAEGAVAFLSGS